MILTSTHIDSLYSTLPAVVEPSITVQPEDAVDVSLGQMVSFMVTAGGDTPTYQWYFVNSSGDLTLIDGAIIDTYTIASVGENDEGMYFCRVSNQAGEVNSSSAILMLCKRERERESLRRRDRGEGREREGEKERGREG